MAGQVKCPNCETILTDQGGICPNCAELVGGLGKSFQPQGRGGVKTNSGISVVPLLKADAVQPPPPKLELETGRGYDHGGGGGFLAADGSNLQLGREVRARAPVVEQQEDPPAPSSGIPTARQRQYSNAQIARAKGGPSPLVWALLGGGVLVAGALAYLFLLK